MDHLDNLTALWAGLAVQVQQGSATISDDPSLVAGMAFGVQMAIAVVSGLPDGVAMDGHDVIKIGGDLARARLAQAGMITMIVPIDGDGEPIG